MTTTLDSLTPNMVFNRAFIDFLDKELDTRQRTDKREDLTTTHSIQAVRTFVDQILQNQASDTDAFGPWHPSKEELEAIVFNASREERAVPLAEAMKEEPLLSAATVAVGLYEGRQAIEELSSKESAPGFLRTLNQNQRLSRNPRPHETLHVAFDAFPEMLRGYVRELGKGESQNKGADSAVFAERTGVAGKDPSLKPDGNNIQ